jgi:c-di-GMP-binding flagellar brake protein YcgR
VLNLDRRSIRAECEIVWVRKDEANDKYLMGLRFTQISYQDRQEIEKFVQHKYSANKVMAH